MFGPRSLSAMPLNLLEPRAAGDRRIDQRNDLYGKVSEHRTATVIDKPMAAMDQDMDEGFSYPSLPESSVVETRNERYPANKENGSSRDYSRFRPEQGPSARQVHKRKPEERSSDSEPYQGYKRRTEERRWDAEPSHGYKRRPDERPSNPEPMQQYKRPMERPRSDPEPIARSREQVKRERCVSWKNVAFPFCCANFFA